MRLERIALVMIAAAFAAGKPSHVRAQKAAEPAGTPQVIDFTKAGQNQTEALKVTDHIYQAIGFGNTFLVVTDGGNVVVDTSSAGSASKHHDLLTKVSEAPIRAIVLTHGHGDHTGGVSQWKQDGTQVITSRVFPLFCAYQDRLAGYFARSNAAQFGFNEDRLRSIQRSPQAKVVPTVTFDDRHDFEVGGVKFEVLHTPGETPDAVSVWIPQYKVAFVGDNIYESFPNIYTLRGTPPRWALDYVASLDRILALEPEIVLPSHGLPMKGREDVKKRLTKYRDAIQYVHDETVRGMNEGKDVFRLMREIKLPAELDLPETYGKISWSVRGIYEGYVGWFDLNPATMYAANSRVADAELVDLAGGPDAVAARSRKITEGGDALKGLRLADAALERAPTHRAALKAKLLALETLKARSGNGLEHGWLNHGIRGVQKVLDEQK